MVLIVMCKSSPFIMDVSIDDADNIGNTTFDNNWCNNLHFASGEHNEGDRQVQKLISCSKNKM